MKKNHVKKSIFNKKGISLVLAIALVAVLFLTTTSFISIAMLQQNETGTSMNTRQAYVSSKSALDMAQELLNDGKLDLPAVDGDSNYYVFYYQPGIDGVHKQKFSTAEDALNFIKNHPEYTIIGDAYVKITNENGSYTMTAVGTEGKYTGDPDDKNTGDLSVKFDVTYNMVPHEVYDSLVMQQKVIANPPSVSGNKFLMMGDQTAYTLLRSARKDQYGTDNSYRTVQSYENTNQDEDIIYIPKNEAGTLPITTYFPLVLDKPIKCTSNSDSRVKYSTYDNGIYFLGRCGKGEKIINDYNSQATDISYYTESNSYGIILDCAYLVVAGNAVSKHGNSGQQGMTLNYYGSGSEKKVVAYFPNGSFFKTYDDSKNVTKTVTYPKGYYLFSSGTDLFNPDGSKTDYKATPNLTEEQARSRIGNIDMYSTMYDSGTLKEMHSGYEGKVVKGKEPVTILGDGGSFSKSISSYSTTQAGVKYTTGWDNYYTYCAPTAMPLSSDSGYYNLYAGKEFNYLWYNTKPMEISDNVKMSLRSDNVILSIGPDIGEAVYYLKDDKYNGDDDHMYNADTLKRVGLTPAQADALCASDPGNKKYTAAGSNKIIQKSSSAEFNIKPYWNKNAFDLKVTNDFEVQMANGTTYTVKEGQYTDIPNYGLDYGLGMAKKCLNDGKLDLSEKNKIYYCALYYDSDGNLHAEKYDKAKDANDFLSKQTNCTDACCVEIKLHDNGTNTMNVVNADDFNLFSYAAKDYFNSHSTEKVDSTDTAINWVNADGSINTGVSASNMTQTDKAIKFEAPSGGTLSSGTYTAKAIYCDFRSTVYANGATLKGDVVSIGADKIVSDGKGLFIDTYSGYPDSKCTVSHVEGGVTAPPEQKEGSMLQVTRDTDLVLDNGTSITLNTGYYYFPNVKGTFNLLSHSFWEGWSDANSFYYASKLDEDVTTNRKIYYTREMVPVDFEGKYY